MSARFALDPALLAFGRATTESQLDGVCYVLRHTVTKDELEADQVTYERDDTPVPVNVQVWRNLEESVSSAMQLHSETAYLFSVAVDTVVADQDRIEYAAEVYEIDEVQKKVTDRMLKRIRVRALEET